MKMKMTKESSSESSIIKDEPLCRGKGDRSHIIQFARKKSTSIKIHWNKSQQASATRDRKRFVPAPLLAVFFQIPEVTKYTFVGKRYTIHKIIRHKSYIRNIVFIFTICFTSGNRL